MIWLKASDSLLSSETRSK